MLQHKVFQPFGHFESDLSVIRPYGTFGSRPQFHYLLNKIVRSFCLSSQDIMAATSSVTVFVEKSIKLYKLESNFYNIFLLINQ